MLPTNWATMSPEKQQAWIAWAAVAAAVGGASAEMDATPSVSPSEQPEMHPKPVDATIEHAIDTPAPSDAVNLFDFEPDWGTAGNAVNEDGIPATAVLRNDLEQNQNEATAVALEESREQHEIGKILLPSFLQANEERPDVDPKLAKMQTLKKAAMEHVRWRSLRAPGDMYTVSISSTMRAVVRKWALAEFARTHVTRHLKALRGTPGVPGSASAAHEEFLAAAHKRSLGVIKLKKEKPFREDYFMLLEALPPIVEMKVGPEQLETEKGKAQAIVQLISKHSGEIVEVDSTRTEWVLLPVLPGSASKQVPEQWFCCHNGVPAGLCWGIWA